MQTNLVVVRPFSSHAVGDLITAADAISQILTSDHANCVVRIAAPTPTPAAAPAAAPAAKTEG